MKEAWFSPRRFVAKVPHKSGIVETKSKQMFSAINLYQNLNRVTLIKHTGKHHYFVALQGLQCNVFGE